MLLVLLLLEVGIMRNYSKNKSTYIFKDILLDIYKDIFKAKYKGIPIKTATQEAFQELECLCLDFSDVQYVLENGFDCARSRRRKEIIEKCIRKGKKVLKVVVERMMNYGGPGYWRIRHAGMFTFKKQMFGEKYE